MTEGSAINEALMKQLLLQGNPNQKITNEAIEAASFLLMQFVVEARNRAAVEAEFDTDNNHGSRSRQRTSVIGMSNSLSDDESEVADGRMTIKPKHVLKVACELLMDFS
mmetsp:Transcript_8958/g.13550  ORF Transcript_8958/g.13550 Transcript_8958/m.13550 type:complete len:109 (+) Transcript_8958:243-569(+)